MEIFKNKMKKINNKTIFFQQVQILKLVKIYSSIILLLFTLFNQKYCFKGNKRKYKRLPLRKKQESPNVKPQV